MNSFFLLITENSQEEKQLLQFISNLNLSQNSQILDVGCGYGKNIKLLQSTNLKVTGVDINPSIVFHNRTEGLDCLTVEEFQETQDKYDVLLMSHVIEHLPPNELLNFMDSYLDRLKKRGYLIIATPLYHPGFYDDFDHVKPYQPTGIDLVFGKRSAQVQYVARNQLKLVDIWFRRAQHKLHFLPGIYLNKKLNLPRLINFILAILFRTSFGFIGRTTGWMGIYRKVSE